MAGSPDFTQVISIKEELGIKDLSLYPSDYEFAVPSQKEMDFENININNKYFNFGTTRCHSVCTLQSSGKLKLSAYSVFRFVR